MSTAPALKVFPTLLRFPAIRPRNLPSIPIGNRTPRPPSSASASAADLQTSINHLYHDLGVIAFAGASNEQIRRIGDVLARTVGEGGVGRLSAELGRAAAGGEERRKVESDILARLWELEREVYADRAERIEREEGSSA